MRFAFPFLPPLSLLFLILSLSFFLFLFHSFSVSPHFVPTNVTIPAISAIEKEHAKTNRLEEVKCFDKPSVEKKDPLSALINLVSKKEQPLSLLKRICGQPSENPFRNYLFQLMQFFVLPFPPCYFRKLWDEFGLSTPGQSRPNSLVASTGSSLVCTQGPPYTFLK